MSLYALIKKIQDLQQEAIATQEWYAECALQILWEETDKRIKKIESRVSQLEKEEGRLLHNKNRSAYWEARSRIHELRGVLGK